MSNCVSFQTQLASIMEILVQAAVLDITKLVDDGSAVLHLEISRREKENLALKRRLQWTESELRTARKRVMRVARQTTVDVQGEGVEADWPRTLIIKKERLEEEYDPEATPKNCHEDTLGSCAHTTDRSGVQGEQQQLARGRDAQRTPAKATEVSPVEELCERETVHKSESQGRFLNETGSEYRALDGLCPQYAVWETVGGTGDLEKDLEPEPGVSGLQRVGATEADCSLCPFHWLDVKPVVGDLGNKVELDRLSEFGGEGQTKEANPQPRECKEREEILSECDGQEVKNLLRVQQHFKDISLRHQVTGSAEAEELNFGMPYKRGFSPCEDSFGSSRSFKSSQRSEVRERRFSCTHCGKTFTQQGHLKIHQLIHTGERPFSCAQCGKSFTHVHVLKRHLSVHTGHRPYTCTYCGKSFTLQDSLRRHQRIHTGERPYVCTYCEKRFTQGSHLKIHQLVHTGVKPFRCTECEKSFTQLHVLKRHLSVHTGQKPYNCVHCGKKFTLQDSLKRHQRLHYVEAPQFPQQLHNNERLLLQDEPNPELNLNFE